MEYPAWFVQRVREVFPADASIHRDIAAGYESPVEAVLSYNMGVSGQDILDFLADGEDGIQRLREEAERAVIRRDLWCEWKRLWDEDNARFAEREAELDSD
jgi:hypothetical protein